MGRPGRLDVASWVLRQAGDGYFSQRDAVVGVGDNQGEVRSNLEGLAELGLIEKSTTGSRPNYRRVDSPIWTALGLLADAVDDMVAGLAKPELEPDPPRGLAARPDEAPIVTLPRESRAGR